MKVKKVKSTTTKSSSIRKDLKQATEEVRLHKKGGLKLKTAQELLNEL